MLSGFPYGRTQHVRGMRSGIVSVIEELLRAEGVRAEPHTLENLITHRSEKFWLSRDCPYVRTFVRMYIRPYVHPSVRQYLEN